jgi:hypothetical protein
MAAADRVYGLPAWVALAIGAILLLALSRKRQPKRKLLFGTMRSSALH